MAELYLVRHGQASFGAEDYDHLSAVGEQQGVWLGEYLAKREITFDRVICGTMRRHEQTLQAISRGLGVQATHREQHAGLDEYDFDALFGALGEEYRELKASSRGSKSAFYKALKKVLRLWSEDKIDGPLPETWQQFQQRVDAAKRDIQGGEGKRVLVVSSGGVMAVMAQQILQAPAETAIALNMQIRNSSFCHYFFNAEAIHLAGFNGTPHLDRIERRGFQTYG